MEWAKISNLATSHWILFLKLGELKNPFLNHNSQFIYWRVLKIKQGSSTEREQEIRSNVSKVVGLKKCSSILIFSQKQLAHFGGPIRFGLVCLVWRAGDQGQDSIVGSLGDGYCQWSQSGCHWHSLDKHHQIYLSKYYMQFTSLYKIRICSSYIQNNYKISSVYRNMICTHCGYVLYKITIFLYKLQKCFVQYQDMFSTISGYLLYNIRI